MSAVRSQAAATDPTALRGMMIYLPNLIRVIYFLLVAFALLFIPRAIDWRNKPHPDTARLITLALLLAMLSNVAVSVRHWDSPLLVYVTPVGMLSALAADLYVIAVWRERRHSPSGARDPRA